MDSFENIFKILVGVFGLVLTILKIIDLSNKSVSKITAELNVLEKTNALGVNNGYLKDHIEKRLSEKYPKMNVPRKRNWPIITISFLLSCGLFYLMINPIELTWVSYKVSILFLTFEMTIFAFVFSIFWTALMNRQD